MNFLLYSELFWKSILIKEKNLVIFQNSYFKTLERVMEQPKYVPLLYISAAMNPRIFSCLSMTVW